MDDFRKTYGTGRTMSGLVAWLGWIVVGIGVLVLVTNGIMLAMTDLALASVPLMTGAVAGLVAVLTGLFGVAAAQLMRAAFDTADMTREMLVLARRSPPRETSIVSKAPITTTPQSPSKPVVLSVSAPDTVPSRPEPVLKSVPRGTTPPRPHPIFSAKPPR